MHLFFAPHQDDELLTLGIGAILRNQEDRKDTHIYLCTDGSGSSVKSVLRNWHRCALHRGVHRYYLNDSQFILARDREFIDSCRALGFPKENIHIMDERVKDGALTVEKAEQMIRRVIEEIEETEELVIHTLFPVGGKQHSDHTCLGLAAKHMMETKAVNRVEWYLEPYCIDEFEASEQKYTLEALNCMNSEHKKRIEDAIAAYTLWCPSDKRYAVGHHSVGEIFSEYSRKPINYRCVRSEKVNGDE